MILYLTLIVSAMVFLPSNKYPIVFIANFIVIDTINHWEG